MAGLTLETAAQRSVTVPEAAELTSISRDVLDIAIKRGELLARYPTSRPVIRLADLDEWLERLPTESPRSSRK